MQELVHAGTTRAMTSSAADRQTYVDALAHEVQESIALTELAISGLRRIVDELSSVPPTPENPDPTIYVGLGDPNLGMQPHGKIKASTLSDYAKQGTGQAEIALSQQWLLAVYAKWELTHRKSLAGVLGVPDENHVMSDLYGDLRLLRNDVAHNGGYVKDTTAAKLKVLTRFAAGDLVRFDAADYIKISANVYVYPKP